MNLHQGTSSPSCLAPNPLHNYFAHSADAAEVRRDGCPLQYPGDIVLQPPPANLFVSGLHMVRLISPLPFRQLGRDKQGHSCHRIPWPRRPLTFPVTPSDHARSSFISLLRTRRWVAVTKHPAHFHVDATYRIGCSGSLATRTDAKPHFEQSGTTDHTGIVRRTRTRTHEPREARSQPTDRMQG